MLEINDDSLSPLKPKTLVFAKKKKKYRSKLLHLVNIKPLTLSVACNRRHYTLQNT